jgi:hypothetical protein
MSYIYYASHSLCHVNYHVLTFDVTCFYFPFSEHRRFQGFSVRSARYESTRENSRSEVNLVDSHYIILKVHYIVESQPLSLINRVVINKKLLY